jgi:hypothetical protein
MQLNGSPERTPPISRRTAMGFGVASGLALASASTDDAFGKTPFGPPDETPQLKAAFEFAIKSNWKSGPGYWAVSYSDDNFTGEPLLIGNPQLMPKPQSGTMPRGWGSKTGSIVVGPSAVLRLIHKADGQDVHVTLLPYESMADLHTVGITDGASSWKLFPAADLKPPY